MVCPKCRQEILGYSEDIYKRHEQFKTRQIIEYSCPRCGQTVIEKETRFGLGTRIIFWIVIIPTVMFVSVAVSYWFSENVTVSLPPLALMSLLFIFMIGGVVLIKYYVHKKNKLMASLAGPPAAEESAARSGVNENFPLSPDPLMNTIRKNAQLSLEKSEEKKKTSLFARSKWFNILFQILLFAIILYFNDYYKFKQMFTDYEYGRTRTQESLIELRVKAIRNALSLEYQKSHLYPTALSGFDSPLIENAFFYENDEDRFLGKTIELSDFVYQSDGESYLLCVKPEWGGKCWVNEDSKREPGIMMCPEPYNGWAPDGRCVWSCAAGTMPGTGVECVCQPGHVETGQDDSGRRICEPAE